VRRDRARLGQHHPALHVFLGMPRNRMPALSPARPRPLLLEHSHARANRLPGLAEAHISQASPTFTLPPLDAPSTQPWPRPEIEKISSIRIRNAGRSRDQARNIGVHRVHQLVDLRFPRGSPFSAPSAEPRITGASSGTDTCPAARALPISTRSISSGSSTASPLVQKHQHTRHAHLARQKHVLLGLPAWGRPCRQPPESLRHLRPRR